MNYQKMLYLSQQDVKNCNVDFMTGLTVAERVFSEHSRGLYEMPPKPGIHPDVCVGAFSHAMPAYLIESGIYGLKWISVFGHNMQKHNVQSLSGLMILNDEQTGYPYAVMDGVHLTNIRTATASGVAVKYLARENSEVLGIVGCGAQGRFNTEMILQVAKNLKEIRIYDLFPASAESYVAHCKSLTDLPVVVCESAEDVITKSDIIVAAATMLDQNPIYKTEWIKKGALVLPVYSRGWEFSTFTNADKFIVDDWNQYRTVLFGEGKYYEETPDLYCQLGDIVSGKRTGRDNDDQIILVGNMGTGLQDVAIAQLIYETAQAKGLGTTLDL